MLNDTGLEKLTDSEWNGPAVAENMLHSPLSTEPSTLVAQLADRLRERIIDGSLPGGERLKQTQLAAVYGVSPIPIREAIKQLESEGFVTVLPFRGATVAVLSVQEIREDFEIGFALHTHGMRLALPNLTEIDFVNAHAVLESMYPISDIKDWSEKLLKFYHIIYDGERWPRLHDLIRRQHFAARRYTDLLINETRPNFNEPDSYFPLLLDNLKQNKLDDAIHLTRTRFDLFLAALIPVVENRLHKLSNKRQKNERTKRVRKISDA